MSASPASALAYGRNLQPHDQGRTVKLRFLEWIWHVDGRVALPAGQSSDEAITRLVPLFHEVGTTYDCEDDTLTFRKKDPAAQDKMSVFDSGVLQVRRGAAGLELHYRMVSRALLFCFLAPLMFLAFGQLTVAVGKYQKSKAETEKSEKKDDKKDLELPQNPIDKWLGAPVPEKPKKDEKREDTTYSPKASYVFASLFAVLYLVGRVLEDRLAKRLFRRRLFST